MPKHECHLASLAFPVSGRAIFISGVCSSRVVRITMSGSSGSIGVDVVCDGKTHRLVLPQAEFNLLASGEFLNGNYHGERSEGFACFHCVMVFVLPSV